jgi:sugar lactone lactonase YvrE
MGRRSLRRPGRSPGADRPNGIVVAEDGTIYVADSNHFRLEAFTAEAEVDGW